MNDSVYLTRKLPQTIVDFLSRHYNVRTYPKEETAVPYYQLIEDVKGTSAILSLLTDKIDDTVMDAAGPSLSIIANMAVGYDNIDLQAAKERSIVVTTTPDILTETTADLGFALLLAAARRIPQAERVLREGRWQTWSPMFLTGQEVYGKTIGIIGLGRIGEAVARRAKGFGMRLLYHNRSRKIAAERSLGAEYTDLMTLMSESDYVVVLVPLTNETKGLIGKKQINAMKANAVFVNIARGDVVDETALYEALSENKIWGAGLDVFTDEPISTQHPFLTLDNVVLVPHIGSAGIETRMKMAMLAAQNIHAVLSGKPPLTPLQLS
ncbi:D-glycerate dehydrogenase [Alicyclobacillus sp. SO9]|uniref:2-hydroxyacid dehydrogenase n=1 Tax=Alicyclobacillus sp. SO9 TaxID=2665646 RepID=UPI0018E9035C|nr:D-glycerate dehydrogenase [Alicyclobacillus sp. SO9]QQE80276.1 D-glycerate dehydrogenase [Alicyclobacillus sp. SO9]